MAVSFLEQLGPAASIPFAGLLPPVRIAMVFNGDAVGGKADVYMVAALRVLAGTVGENPAKIVKQNPAGIGDFK